MNLQASPETASQDAPQSTEPPPVTLTPEEAEAKAKEAYGKLSEEQKAYYHFKLSLAKFSTLLRNSSLARKNIVNTWDNAALAPFDLDRMKFSYPEEKDLFEAFMEMNAAKSILMMYGFAEKGFIKILRPLVGEEKAEVDKPVA